MGKRVTEVLFYHLERRGLEEVLPPLLEKCVERGWRVVVQVSDEARRDALNAHLWTFRDDAFLPHGAAGDGNAEAQPVWLTAGDDNPNAASVRFLADGADIDDPSPYARVVYVFNGRDEAAVAAARERWKHLNAAGHDVTYWRQTDRGGWERKA